MEDREWRDASLFLSKGPSATLEFLQEEPRALLWAYWRQSVDGPMENVEGSGGGEYSFGLSDLRLRKRREAWKGLGDMAKSEARRLLVELLTEVLPEWRSWCREHAERIRKEQEAGGEAEKLLRAFSMKTGFVARSNM